MVPRVNSIILSTDGLGIVILTSPTNTTLVKIQISKPISSLIFDTITLYRTEDLFHVEIGKQRMKYKVIQKFINEQQTMMLLKLDESIEFDDLIQPACLPQPQLTNRSKIVCWVGDWLAHLSLKLASNTDCRSKHLNTKRLRIKGVHNATNVCTIVENGDATYCKVNSLKKTENFFSFNDDSPQTPSSILLNGNQEIVGVATGLRESGQQIFLQLSDHVYWIENIVWASSSLSSTITTTEVTSESSRKKSSTRLDLIR